MRQLRVNVALLALAVSPLIFAICANLATGGSFSATLTRPNLWVIPFLLVSGAAAIVFNFMQIADRQREGRRNKPAATIMAAKPAVDRIIGRLALTSTSESTADSGEFDDAAHQPAPEASSDTLEGLVAELWAPPGSAIRPLAYRSAWRLAGLVASPNVRAAMSRIDLTAAQLSEPRLEWLVRPRQGPTSSDDHVDVILGRIGYLLRNGGISYLPPPPLTVDPYLAMALIVVWDKGISYHSACPAFPHGGDADGILMLNSLHRTRHSSVKGDRAGEFEREPGLDPEQLTYHDIGELIRPELEHTRSVLAGKQAAFVRHVMRHFLTDELSGALFDTLPDATQARFAKALLTASEWTSPAEWQRWAKTGRSTNAASRDEEISNSSFAAAAALAACVVLLGCWQLVDWVAEGWSWYFSPAHLLGTWPGWLKAVVIVSVFVFFVIWLIRTEVLGAVVAIVASIWLAVSIVASPVVRIHAWISSWGTAATIVLGGLIMALIVASIGYLYDDRRPIREPVRLTGVVLGSPARLAGRPRFRPDHGAGHSDWCVTATSFE